MTRALSRRHAVGTVLGHRMLPEWEHSEEMAIAQKRVGLFGVRLWTR